MEGVKGCAVFIKRRIEELWRKLVEEWGIWKGNEKQVEQDDTLKFIRYKGAGESKLPEWRLEREDRLETHVCGLQDCKS